MRSIACLFLSASFVAVVAASCTTSVSGGGGCTTDADCGTGYLCGFPESEACIALGECFPAPGAVCDMYGPGCACDGTTINIACTGLPVGYASKPLKHTGACTDGGCTSDDICLSTMTCSNDTDCATLGSMCDPCTMLCGCGSTACCPAGWLMYTCDDPDGGTGLACHNPALGCASSLTCGEGCDFVVQGRCNET
jgi:hypothetical protein